jgi:hypothetical protein
LFEAASNSPYEFPYIGNSLPEMCKCAMNQRRRILDLKHTIMADESLQRSLSGQVTESLHKLPNPNGVRNDIFRVLPLA